MDISTIVVLLVVLAIAVALGVYALKAFKSTNDLHEDEDSNLSTVGLAEPTGPVERPVKVCHGSRRVVQTGTATGSSEVATYTTTAAPTTLGYGETYDTVQAEPVNLTPYDQPEANR